MKSKDIVKKLNILFWLFVIGSIIGYIFEMLLVLLKKGFFETRQGLIYGPFIPVYGIGAIIYYLVLNNIDDYLLSINENFVSEQAMANAKRIEFLQSFLMYIKSPAKLYNYPFNVQAQNEIALIKTFETVHESSFKKLIDSINATDFTFTSDKPDQKGVLKKTENFLKGGLAVWKNY